MPGLRRAQARLDNLSRLADEGVLVDSAREHAALLDALDAGDVSRVERTMRQHLGHVRGLWTRPRRADVEE